MGLEARADDAGLCQERHRHDDEIRAGSSGEQLPLIWPDEEGGSPQACAQDQHGQDDY
jgi:hypothetical protein